jgi:DNA-binding transcriptional ArsR family regulator
MPPDDSPPPDRGSRAEAALTNRMDIAREASEFLKALAHEGRLMILCHLAERERSVTELEQLLSQRQAAVSQQLARLRLEGLVRTRREGKTVFYSLADEKTRRMIDVVLDLFEPESASSPR